MDDEELTYPIREGAAHVRNICVHKGVLPADCASATVEAQGRP